MPLESISRLMADCQEGGYAIGYFESWNLESLQGVLDAAEQTRATETQLTDRDVPLADASLNETHDHAPPGPVRLRRARRRGDPLIAAPKPGRSR